MRGQMNISPVLTAAAIALGMIASMTGAQGSDAEGGMKVADLSPEAIGPQAQKIDT